MKILVIEDEKKVAGVIKRGLEGNEYSVTVANDGVEGLKQAQSGDFSLVILDLLIPKIDGLTVIRKLREAGCLMPVLIISALGATEDIVSSLDAGSDDYLTKPFVFAELLARVRALLRRSTQRRGTDIFFADLRLDPVSHMVWRCGTNIKLSAKEYAVVEYMVRNPNTVLPRAMIYEHVWREISFGKFTNIVNVYFNYLRIKIDKPYPIKLFHTVRGQGYILREG